MSKRLYHHRRVRYWYSYNVEEICEVFSDSKLHPQTIRKWIKNGLSTVDTKKPALVYGNELISYLKKNNNTNKCKTEFDEMYCMRCQDAQPVFRQNVSIEQKRQFLKVQGACRQCKQPMFKNYKLLSFKALRKKFRLVDVLELYDFDNSTNKTHMQAQQKNAKIESTLGKHYGELF
jgi:hypothetical protein